MKAEKVNKDGEELKTFIIKEFFKFAERMRKEGSDDIYTSYVITCLCLDGFKENLSPRDFKIVIKMFQNIIGEQS